jgi:hypothetical protein
LNDVLFSEISIIASFAWVISEAQIFSLFKRRARQNAARIEEGSTCLLHQMPTICDLRRVCRVCRSIAISATPVTGNDSDRGEQRARLGQLRVRDPAEVRKFSAGNCRRCWRIGDGAAKPNRQYPDWINWERLRSRTTLAPRLLLVCRQAPVNVDGRWSPRRSARKRRLGVRIGPVAAPRAAERSLVADNGYGETLPQDGHGPALPDAQAATRAYHPSHSLQQPTPILTPPPCFRRIFQA